RKQAEESRRELEIQLGSMLAAFPCGTAAELIKQAYMLHLMEEFLPICVWTVDRQGVVTSMEGKGLKAHGVTRAYFVGKHGAEIYATWPEGLALQERALAGEIGHAPMESVGISWESWFIPVRDEHGAVESMIGFSLDTTELRHTEQELRAK